MRCQPAEVSPRSKATRRATRKRTMAASAAAWCPAQPVVVEPARLYPLTEQQLQVDVLESLVHPPQRDPPRQDVEHHHREALGVRGVGEGMAWEVFVEHVEHAELLHARPDDGEVPGRAAADLEVVDEHAP